MNIKKKKKLKEKEGNELKTIVPLIKERLKINIEEGGLE